VLCDTSNLNDGNHTDGGIFHLLSQLAADTAHTTNTTTQEIYRNTKFKNRIKLTTIYENHKCSTINHKIHENLKILKYTIAKSIPNELSDVHSR